MSQETYNFDSEGGAMRPVTPKELPWIDDEFWDDSVDDTRGMHVIGFAVAALSGFVVALLLTWIF